MDAKPRRVLFAIDAMARGGTELQLSGLISRLDRRRFKPVLLTLRPSPPELVPDDCESLAWNIPRLISVSGLRGCIDLARWMRAHDVSAVHSFFQDATVFAGFAARMAGVQVRVAGFRDLGFWRTRSQEAFVRMAYPCFTGFVANSMAVKNHFCEKDGLSPTRVQVIANGIDVANLSWVDHEGPVQNVVIVGNLNRPVKRIDLFVRAAGYLHEEFPDVCWHICGDGGLRSGLEALAEDLGVGKKLIFHGRVGNVSEMLESMQIGVNCSDSEGFSNAVLEYMLKGCAVVATDIGGNSEAVYSDECGVLVAVDDAESLTAGIRALLVDRARRRKMAQDARRYAESAYTWDRCIQAHENLYAGGASNC